MFSSMYLNPLPTWLKNAPAKWAWVSLTAIATLPGSFNRTAFVAPWAADVSDSNLAQTLTYMNTTDFVAYDLRFFDIIGPNATVEHVQKLAYQTHEAPCYIKDTNQLFFTEWGPPGGDDGIHTWQYLLDIENNTLRKIETNPPTNNAHGCIENKGSLFVVTDGNGDKETGQLIRIDPLTLKKTVILNNFVAQPFGGFNDLEIDPHGNFYLADSKSGWGREIVDFALPTRPSIYFVNATSMQPKVVWQTDGNANGIAISPDGKHVYIPDTGVSQFRPSYQNPYGKRAVWDFQTSAGGAVLSGQRLLTTPISYFYDGIRASREGWLFGGAGDGVDVIDPDSGFVLGSIRVGGGKNVAVNVVFGEHEMWIVGKGGVWHVKNIKSRLRRDW